MAPRGLHQSRHAIVLSCTKRCTSWLVLLFLQGMALSVTPGDAGGLLDKQVSANVKGA